MQLTRCEEWIVTKEFEGETREEVTTMFSAWNDQVDREEDPIEGVCVAEV